MKTIKILGTGCANCRTTFSLVEAIAKEKKVEISLEKVEDLQQILAYGVLTTPGVVVDGKVMHAGGVPTRSKVESWF